MTSSEMNPLLDAKTPFPQFATVKPEHVVPAVRATLARCEDAFVTLERTAHPTWEDLMEPLDAINRDLSRVWGPIAHLYNVANSPALREAYTTVLPEVVSFSLRMGQSTTLFNVMQTLRNSDRWVALNTAQKRALEQALRNAKESGIGLAGAQRERFNAISQRLSELSSQFRNNVLDATKSWTLPLTAHAEVEGLPANILAQASQSYNRANRDHPGTPENGPWLVTLDGPSYLSFMQNSRRRDLREKVWRAFTTRASCGDVDNTQVISETLRLRKELAELLGFESYAALSVSAKMAGTVTNVEKLHDDVSAGALRRARSELEKLTELARRNGQTEPLEAWDVAFWFQRYNEEKFEFSEEILRSYFPLPKVLAGLFSLITRLFDVSVVAADGEAPVWDPDVRFFGINSASGERLGHFYLDLYARPQNKRDGAWADNAADRRRIGNHLELPLVYVCCNFMPPSDSHPARLTSDNLRTLFHEMGHALQHLLTTVECGPVSGFNGIEWDTVELASQFMENWCYDPSVLKSLSSHTETGEPLPDALIERLRATRYANVGAATTHMLWYGKVDMELHHSFDPHGTQEPLAVMRAIGEQTRALPPNPEERLLNSFSHIFAGGYAAGYYSYMWAAVLSDDAFSAFEEAGLENEKAVRELGLRYRNTILAHGGSRHPAQVFAEFRGRPHTTEPFLQRRGLQ